VVNVYSKCDISAKRRLWNNLLACKRGIGDGRWCVVGDFNAVRRSEERSGINSGVVASTSMECIEFGDFLEELELVDLPLLGRQFTWFQSGGRAMSRIDRILISDEWASKWGWGSLWVLPRDVSDHCPLLLKYLNRDWGPKPFRFNNFWLENKNLPKVVESYWSNHHVEGWMGFVVKEKLKGLKLVLKDWHKHAYGGLEDRIGGLVVEIRDLDSKGEEVGLSSQEVEGRKTKFGELWRLLKSKEALIFQRSRSKWLKEADMNSKFFHGCVNSRAKRNSILALKVGDLWIDKPIHIKEAVVNFFENHFSSSNVCRPNLDGVHFPSLSTEENDILSAPFSLEEVHSAVMDGDGNKSPGPDGFNNAFLKNCWDIIKGEIRIMFDQFHGIGSLPKSMLSYFVTLIPKVNSPFGLKDFRPISLLGSLYKLIAKVLAARLAKVMDVLVAPTQSAFLKGRNLVDGVLVVNELVDWAKRQNKQCLIFKVDFEKAYDSVD
jgi:hypothetical protein